MSGQTDLYELRLVRYLKDEEWSPWNCILLTHQEADIHAQLGNLFKVCQNSGFLMKKAAQDFFLHSGNSETQDQNNIFF
jgi:flavorubredoxin